MLNNILLYDSFIQHNINESYSFVKEKEDGKSIKYTFYTGEMEMRVDFSENGEECYERMYGRVVDNRVKFDMVNGNPIAILSTVTNITMSFIKEYEPSEIAIYHVDEEKERRMRREFISRGEMYINQRAKLNKRFIERSLPSNYAYRMVVRKYSTDSLIEKQPDWVL